MAAYSKELLGCGLYIGVVYGTGLTPVCRQWEGIAFKATVGNG